jgi:chemotaxis protein methyltransferase CheR
VSAPPDTDFAYVSREVRARSGLVLSPDKAPLIESRLAPIARREGFLSVQELITTTRARGDERLAQAIVEALISAETQFFRDRTPFEAFRQTIAAELGARRGPGARLRLWCAGCSTGQEPYSLAMALEEMRGDGRGVECELVASDLSLRLLEKARAGLYSQFEVQRGLPIHLLLRHFEKVGDLWRISDRIRAQVRFQPFNLLSDMGSLGRFDIIFCRNVLSAFDPEARATTLARLASVLAEDGYLILGAGEQIDPTDGFAPAPGRACAWMRRSADRRAA